MSTIKLFAVFSHTLTTDQVEDFKLTYGEAEIVTLKEVDPLLQNQASNIDPRANLYGIQQLAASIVVEAIKAEATHFYIAGEPTLVMWANLYAAGKASYEWNTLPHSILGYGWIKVNDKMHEPNLICIQSTTERKSSEVAQPDGTVLKTAVFQHVQWRKIFE